MQVRVWQSYSCNNSSSFRLVARFADAKTAKGSADELTTLFKDHGKQGDKALAAPDRTDEDWPPPTKACADIATKYGFTWREWLHWGDYNLRGWEPITIAHDDTVLIYHGFSNGFPQEITTYLKKRGATKVVTVEDERDEPKDGPTVSVLFTVPTKGTKGKKLEALLRKVFAQAGATTHVNEWKLKPPWSGKAQFDGYSEKVAFFSDGNTIGFYLTIDPRHIDKLKKYLAKQGVQNPTIRICEENDRKKFQVIAGARCDACQTPLSYIDPRTHEIEGEQLACEKCGGMFELATFTAKHDKAVRAAARAAKKTTKKKKAAKKK